MLVGVLSVAGLISLMTPRLGAQPELATKPPVFEVASLKPSTSGINGVRGGRHGIDSKYNPADAATAPPLGRCAITDGRLSHLIAIAYRPGAIGLIARPDCQGWRSGCNNDRYSTSLLNCDDTAAQADIFTRRSGLRLRDVRTAGNAKNNKKRSETPVV